MKDIRGKITNFIMSNHYRIADSVWYKYGFRDILLDLGEGLCQILVEIKKDNK